jgi:Flp pilus assembly protein TadD
MGGSRSHFGGLAENSNIGVALRAQVALEQGDLASAVSFAERAVEKSPTDAAFRSLLGNAYLAAGRFRSAEAAFADALALYPKQAGVPLKLALAQAAQGRGDASTATLDTYADVISPADSGLALALAGRPGAAVEVLELAARRPDADARLRQNLALAHAIAGDWSRARQVAAQDLAGDQLEQRMSEWASFARPGASATQVAALIGVKAPASVDVGMPVRLALRAPAGSNAVRSADARPSSDVQPTVFPTAPALASAEPMPGLALPSPSAEPMPVEVAAVNVAEHAQPIPTTAAAPDVVAMVDSLRSERVRPEGGLPRIAELRRSAAKRFRASKAVVQLGAYATQAGVKAGWTVLARRHRGLSAYIPASARFAGSRGTVYRLSLKGFGSDREARQLCMQLKASGATCFVRTAAGDAPVRFASR